MSCATSSGCFPPACTTPRNGNWTLPSVPTLYLPLRSSCPKTRTSKTSPGPRVVSSTDAAAAMSCEMSCALFRQAAKHNRHATTTNALDMLGLVGRAQASIHLEYLIIGRVGSQHGAVVEVR